MSGVLVLAAVQAVLKGMNRFRDTYTASTLAFDAATKTISDTANGLIWLKSGDPLTVAGSGSNNGTYTVAADALAGSVTVVEALVNEGAGAAVTLTAPEHVTRGDYRVMNRGLNECAVLTVGIFDQQPLTVGGKEEWTWDVLIDIFERDQQDGQAWDNFNTLRDDVLDILRDDPTLSDYGGLKITAYGLEAVDDPLLVHDTGKQGPKFVAQTIRASYTELVDRI